MSCPGSTGIAGTPAGSTFLWSPRESGGRRSSSHPPTVPEHWHAWPWVSVLLPCLATSQLPAPPSPVPPKAKVPCWLILLCESFSLGSSACLPCPPSSGRRTNNGSFHSHWGREERKSLPGQRLPNRLLFVPSSTWIFPDLK